MSLETIIVFSHLRWDSVFQRPQQLMTLLSGSSEIVFVEEPIYDSTFPPWIETIYAAPRIRVCRPHSPIDAPGFNDVQMAFLGPSFRELVSRVRAPYACWLYTPLAVPLIGACDPSLVVYDCMDELSAFLHASPALIDREAELLARADVVFTGGPSLYRAKKDRHPNVHCLPSSVDVAHYRQANTGLVEPDDQRPLPRPRLGFFGVIDERIDYELINQVAIAKPDWQIVMIGPVVKVRPEQLPRHPNLHYLGQREYALLPAYVAGWDVCLLPFALNESTRFISPTKTLEYMAAERPIVSTPVCDVKEPYGDVVLIGASISEFIAACEQALRCSPQDQAQRLARMRSIVSRTSWKATAEEMRRLMDEPLISKTRHRPVLGRAVTA